MSATSKKQKQSRLRKHARRISIVMGVLLAIIIIGGLWLLFRPAQPEHDTAFGATFSTKYSKELGINWQAAYTASLDELGIRLFRIPVYWDEIETEQGEIDLSDIEWMMDEADAYGAQVILAIGQRVPRWPECHPPVWTASMERSEIESAERAMMQTVVERFKEHPALYRWQVHNEPFFSVFGLCDTPNTEFLVSTMKEVGEWDPNHPVMTTDSGELSTWLKPAAAVDVLGVSLYRTTWNKLVGYFYYPIPPQMYTLKAKYVDQLVDEVIVSELQTEPWIPAPYHITTLPLDEQYRSMSPDRMRDNIEFAQSVGFRETLLWGIEWWYWLKETQDDSSMWELGLQLFSGEL